MKTELIFAVIVPVFSALKEQYFVPRNGYLLTETGGSNPECSNTRDVTRTGCAVMCLNDDACKTFSYREGDGCCVLNSMQLYDFGVKYEENSAWDYYGPDVTEVIDEEWTLVFKAVSGTNNNLWDAWSQTGMAHDVDLSSQHPGHFSKYTASSNYPFYRSHWLDTWPSSAIKEVRLGLYENGTEVSYLHFDGAGSNRDDWFSYSRLILYPWGDLSVLTPVIFSLPGSAFRKFYITMASSLSNCDNFGWLIVLNRQTNLCDFDKESPPPQFLYSKASGGTYFKYKVYGLAEVLAVFVKF